MSIFYNPQRTKNLYIPASSEPYKLSRTKIDLFIQCPRCFYLDRRLGVERPPGFPFTLNNAVDALLKKEFDRHRNEGTNHPLLEKYGIDARPVPHEELSKWRNNFTGIQFLDKETNLLIFGAIDDLWQNSNGDYIVVDYKATAKDEKITELNKGWQIGYKRQMEIYQWLIRKNNYTVSDTGYFVYCNGKANRDALGGKLEFDITLIPYIGNDSWIDDVIYQIHTCLNGNTIPDSSEDCDYCRYNAAVNSKTKESGHGNWSNCKIETLYFDGTPTDSNQCEVRIDGKNIVVSYVDEEFSRTVLYKGQDHGAGHYELSCKELQGRATLHRLAKDSFNLEGSWEELGYVGMWRIELVE